MFMDDGKIGALWLPLVTSEQAKYLLMGENSYSEKTKKLLHSKIQ
jgi:hypothetical protein